ncbi:MAG: hypothetical protein ACRDQD_28785 [Nocardioidaceae bacterium]
MTSCGEIQEALRRFPRRRTRRSVRRGSGARPAAVAITVILGSSGPAVLLTR